MPTIPGKQIKDAPLGLTTTKLNDGILSADATGRAKMASSYFDSATFTAKVAAAAVADSRLAELYIKADGTRAFTADQSHGGFKITSLAAGTAATDAVNKGQLDAVSAGLDPKGSVRLATAAALAANTAAGSGVGKTLTADANGALSVDGVAVVVGNRILVKNETPASDNGIYTVTATGSAGAPYVLTRATDFDEGGSDVTAGAYCFVEEGTANGDKGFVLTTDNPITVDTTSLAFTQFSTFALGGTPTTVNAGDVAAEGTSSSSARSDHEHAVSTAAPGTTAKSEATAAAEGTATSLMRSDAQIQVATATPATTVKSEATAASQGTSSSMLRADAQIQAATATPTTTVKSEATAASQGTASTMLRSDAQIQAATATAVALSSANGQGTSSSLARADHTHEGVAFKRGDKDFTPAASAGADDFDTTIDISDTPALDSGIDVFLNGIRQKLGDGTKVSVEFFFSADGGATARALSAVIATDGLFFNPTVAGFDLATTDRIALGYSVLVSENN